MEDYSDNWKIREGWLFRESNPRILGEGGTKIFISVDPNDIKKAKRVFKYFLDRYNLYGKMSYNSVNERNTLIIYTPLIKELLVELEYALQKNGIRPRLLKSGNCIPDIAIKGSLYFYFKCDELKVRAYNNKKQVRIMDKIRNTTKYDDIEIIKRYKEIDLSNMISVKTNFKGYNERNEYFKYLGMIIKCNAVQRQILDSFFRNELKTANGAINWYKFDQKFIINRLQLVEIFIENTKNIPESELRKFLSYFIIGGYIDSEPILTKRGGDFINNIKTLLEDNKISDIKDEFLNMYTKLGVNMNLQISPIKKNFLDEIKDYYSNADFYDLAFGDFALKHLSFIINDFLNYYRENNLVVGKELEEVQKLLDLKKIEEWYGATLEKKYNNYYSSVIFDKIKNITDVIEKNKEIIALRTAENEYNLFIEKYSYELRNILNDKLKRIIKSLLNTLFSYKTTIEEKIKARNDLRYNLYNIKKYYKYLNGIGHIENYKPQENVKSFLMWNSILKSENNEELLNNIDIFRRRYIKYNNVKYNFAEQGGLIKTTLENPMIFARGINVSDKTADKFLKNGMDGEYIDYAVKSDFNIVKDNTLHKGLLSVTTDMRVANRYAYNNKNSKIFLISVPTGTEVLNSIFNDSRCCEYSELDLISVPAEWIIGYLKIDINSIVDKRYIFKKNPNFKDNKLSKKFKVKNDFGVTFELVDGKKYYSDIIELILEKSDFERERLQSNCITEIIRMINDIINNSNSKAKSSNFLEKIKNLFSEDLRDEVENILRKICITYKPNRLNFGFKTLTAIINNGKIHYILPSIYNNYYKLKGQLNREFEEKNSDIQEEKEKKEEDEEQEENNIDFSNKSNIIKNINKLYRKINRFFGEKSDSYKKISEIIKKNSLMVLSDEKNKILELFTSETDVIYRDISKLSSEAVNNYNEDTKNENYLHNDGDDSLEKVIVKNSVNLLQTIKNEIDDMGKPEKDRKNTEEKSDLLNNFICFNLKNGLPNEKIFSDIINIFSYRFGDDEEEKVEEYPIDI